MDEYESLSHTKWECKYHAVFIPKCRRKTLYQELRMHLTSIETLQRKAGAGRRSRGPVRGCDPKADEALAAACQC
jgi:hypothetical protein